MNIIFQFCRLVPLNSTHTTFLSLADTWGFSPPLSKKIYSATSKMDSSLIMAYIFPFLLRNFWFLCVSRSLYLQQTYRITHNMTYSCVSEKLENHVDPLQLTVCHLTLTATIPQTFQIMWRRKRKLFPCKVGKSCVYVYLCLFAPLLTVVT